MRQHLTVILVLTLLSATALLAAPEVPSSGTNLGSVTGGAFIDAHIVIENKCVSCHSGKRIEDAIASGKDMLKIQQRMEQKGAKLTSDEQSVLRIFWKESPFKDKK